MTEEEKKLYEELFEKMLDDEDEKYEGAYSPTEARWEHIFENKLWESVYKLSGQINIHLKALMGRNGRDMDFTIPKASYPIVVIAELVERYTGAGWKVKVVDRVETETENVYVLRFTR